MRAYILLKKKTPGQGQELGGCSNIMPLEEKECLVVDEGFPNDKARVPVGIWRWQPQGCECLCVCRRNGLSPRISIRGVQQHHIQEENECIIMLMRAF
jgi:hypothetical protein